MSSIRGPGAAKRSGGQVPVSAEAPTGFGTRPTPAASQSFGIGERPEGGGAAMLTHVPVVTPSNRPKGDAPPKLERTPLPPV